MAYDSATATQEALNAYQRAIAAAEQRRAQLGSQYGLNANGSLDNTAAGQLGSIYQGNLGSVMQDEAAEKVDSRRGFRGGGLGGKAQAAAEQQGLNVQAVNFRNAAQDIGAVEQDKQATWQDYQNQLGQIGRNAAWDTAQTVIDNPIQAAAANPVTAFANPTAGSISPAKALAQKVALAKNPRAAQVARNNRY